MHSELYQSGQIGSRKTLNRFVAQAMEGNDGADGGAPGERSIERYRKLAEGGWGVVILEATTVSPDSLARINGFVMRRENLEAFKKLVGTFKKTNPDALLFFQITHAGEKAGSFSRPTALYARPEGPPPLSEADVEEIRKAFVGAALLAEEAGADGIDFKICHGYFGCEMMRPANVRPDRWGGSFENRTRFLTEGIGEIRSRLTNPDFILGARVSLYEGIRGGCGTAGADELTEDLEEMLRLPGLLKELGMHYINVSAGIPGRTSEITRPTPQARWFYLHLFRYARLVKELGTGLTVFGSGYSLLKEKGPELAAENIRRGYTDFAGWGRQIFADPLFPRKLMQGDQIDYCIGCSGCSKLMVRQLNDGCSVYDPYYKDLLKAR
jgi:2,4-dienoyl-CoA reductase-like NADH-dependent reductase (Old Yellow Enzyme family)